MKLKVHYNLENKIFFWFEVHLLIFCGERISDAKLLKYPSYKKFGAGENFPLSWKSSKYGKLYGVEKFLSRNSSIKICIGNGADVDLLGSRTLVEFH